MHESHSERRIWRFLSPLKWLLGTLTAVCVGVLVNWLSSVLFNQTVPAWIEIAAANWHWAVPMYGVVAGLTYWAWWDNEQRKREEEHRRLEQDQKNAALVARTPDDVLSWSVNRITKLWEQIRGRAEAESIADIELLKQYDIYDQSLYQARVGSEAMFNEFLRGTTRRAILFVGRAGAGKTVLLAHLCHQALDGGDFALWFRAAEWHGEDDLERALKYLLPPSLGDSCDDRLRAFNGLLSHADIDQRALIFVDGVNEAADPAALVREITRLLNTARDLERIRVVSSCREETFARYPFVPTKYWSPDDPPRPKRDGEAGEPSGVGLRPDAYAIRLETFSGPQLATMWAAYAERYDTLPKDYAELPHQAQELARRNPLMLRLVAQAFTRDRVAEALSSLVVFRRYFDYFVEGDPPLRAEPTTVGERDLLNLLADQLTNLESGEVRRIGPVAELRRAADERRIPWEAYETLLSKGVLQGLRKEGGLGTEPYIGFAFDRMFEFVLAQRLHDRNYQAPGQNLEELIQRSLEYAPFWGAARVLVFLELEAIARRQARMERPAEPQAAAWLAGLLAEAGAGVRALATDALAQLGEEDPQFVAGICLELLRTGEISAGHVAVAVAVKGRLPGVLLAGCALPDRDTRRRAAQGAIYLWQQHPDEGVALWRQLGEEARVEVARTFGSWLALARSATGLFLKAAQQWSLDRVQEDAERLTPTFVALSQVCMLVTTFSLNHAEAAKPIQEAFGAILSDHIRGKRGDLVNALFKAVCTHMLVASFHAAKQKQPLELELARIAEDQELREAYRRLIPTWDDRAQPLPAGELAHWIGISARGGYFGTVIIRAALLARLRQNPEEAVEIALTLADADDRVASMHGLTAAGDLVLGAVALGRRESQPPWFHRLAAGLEENARRIFSGPSTTVRVFEANQFMVDLEHVFLARQLTIGELKGLVSDLRSSAKRLGNVEGEVQIIRSLGVLPMLDLASDGLDALELWSDSTDDNILEVFAVVIAEILSAHSLYVDGWIDRLNNPALEFRINEKLLEVRPEELVFKNGIYTFVALACDPNAARAFIPVLEEILESTTQLEDGLRIFGNLLFDLYETPITALRHSRS